MTRAIPPILLALLPSLLGSACAAGGAAHDVPVPTPLADGVRFSPRITNPWLPLSSVRQTVLEGGGERVLREVQDETRTVGGVECLVLDESEYAHGELEEVSHNCFAQDGAGNVWYFGEDVDEYEGGQVTGHGGAWMVGRNATEPCLFLPAEPRVGLAFRAENSPPDALEHDEVAALGRRTTVPAGTFDDTLVIHEGDRPGEWSETKTYARGVGLISENGTLNLVSYRRR